MGLCSSNCTFQKLIILLTKLLKIAVAIYIYAQKLGRVLKNINAQQSANFMEFLQNPFF